ncbi:LysE family translocator [Nonomuraea muscovyensis]|uniref:Threonine/homoserine/homoserine lactone efflux protein n=1 Tax=Nonomuraea muscovyensis TaxID=1124761 RepID=A0A7X0F2V1_9ACTN|nr:LysE family translocator [Nonomuraea muscovyensis]MBB6350886.1 threonine/homoserine/homoserine lactone efflux protein [Nonomuraea muscovyensis]MDF2709832.1 LysE family translocator [Nonomuraea muscovyensis]
MIPWSVFLVFVGASLALVLLPGPNHLYITARGLAQGRAAALASAFGVETGTLVHIAAAAAGLSYVISRSATLFGIVKWAGVAYLVYLGVRAFTAKDGPGAEALKPQPLRTVFLEGVLVNVLNPKVTLFFLALLPQFVDPAAGSPALQIVLLGVTLLLLGLLSDIAYAFTAGALGGRLARRARALRYFSGVVYLGLGVATAFTGRK